MQARVGGSCAQSRAVYSSPLLRRHGTVALAISLLLLCSPYTVADDTASPTTEPTELAPVVVTANRVATPTSEVGSSVSVISGEDLANTQVSTVADALRSVPGVNVVRSGGPAQITSVFMRGADSDHTLVLIDGIEANDPTSPERAFDFSTLTPDDIDHIEVLRGPQSTLWGSNAIGGVINIITKRGEGPPTGYVYTEDGSYDTFREGAGVSGGNKTVNYSFSFSQANSQGFPSVDDRFTDRLADGYTITTAAEKVGWNISDNLNIDFVCRYQTSDVGIYTSGGGAGVDPNAQLQNTSTFLAVQPHLSLLDGKWVQSYNVSYTYYDRADTYTGFPSHLNGGLAKLDWQNDFHIADNNTVTAGATVGHENIDELTVVQRTDDTYAGYLQDAVNFDKRLFLTAGGRYDALEVGGQDFTYRGTAAYIFPTQTTLRGSYGTGFKAPSLSDLYSPFGSTTLKPEKSTGWDAGVEQSLFHDRFTANVTYFSNQFRDLLDYNPIANMEDNIGHARSEGVELGATLRPIDELTLTANYTYTSTKDFSTDGPLLRRPPNAVSAQATWDYCRKGQITVAMNYESSRADIDPITFNDARVPGYVVFNLATSYQLTDHVQLTMRMDNVLNNHYQEVDGYQEPDFSIFGGVKVTF
jgi:vitamin B12 transporter